MKKTLVVNLNFAVDKTVAVKNFKKGNIYRLSRVITLAGGKGVNVARALKTLGGPVMLTGFVGGHSGRWIAEALAREGLDAVCVPCGGGESRFCLSVADERDGVSTDFNEEGFLVTRGEAKLFLAKFRQCLDWCDIAVFSGRICPGLGDDFFGELIKTARAMGKETALDTSGPALKAALRAGPELFKMNRDEFEYAAGEKLSAPALRRFFSEVSRRGCGYAVVTDGPSPTLAAAPDGFWKFYPPKLNPASPVGAGDSFMAGLIYGRAKGFSRRECVRLALGAAASDCMSLGAGMITKSRSLAFAKLAGFEKMRGNHAKD